MWLSQVSKSDTCIDVAENVPEDCSPLAYMSVAVSVLCGLVEDPFIVSDWKTTLQNVVIFFLTPVDMLDYLLQVKF